MAKQYNINNFSGMGDEGVYYLEGMSPAKKNGHSILTPSWRVRDVITEGDTGWTNLDEVKAIDFFGHLEDGDGGRAIQDAIFTLDKARYIHSTAIIESQGQGEIHKVYSSAPYSTGTDLKVTTLGNLIYTSNNYLGIGYKIFATSGTTTSITATGTNFTTLGLGTTNGINKVYNFNTEEEYTITSIGGTSNDTINFTAGTGTPAEDDVLFAFVDTKWDLNGGDAVYPQFLGQDDRYKWKRQIKAYGENYYILNGNWLAVLDKTNAVFNADEKQLPNNTDSLCMGINDSKLLIAGENKDNGINVLWDADSDGWNSIRKTERGAQSIVPYNEGWIVLMRTSLYYTNGYVLQKLSTLPDGGRYQDTGNIYFNGMEIIGDKILLGANYNDYTRRKDGVYIYTINEGWSFAPVDATNVYPTKDVEIGVIKMIKNQLFIGYEAENTNYIGEISESGGANKKIITAYLELKDKQLISQIKLSVAFRFDHYSDRNSSTSDITVSIDDGSSPHFNYGQTKSTSTTTTIYNDSAPLSCGLVGQEIEMLEGVNAGERSFITAITNAGTDDEAWTMSPAFSNDFTYTDNYQRYNFVKCDTKTIGSDDLNSTIDFNVPRTNTDKLFIEVVMSGDLILDLNSITVK